MSSSVAAASLLKSTLAKNWLMSLVRERVRLGVVAPPGRVDDGVRALHVGPRLVEPERDVEERGRVRRDGAAGLGGIRVGRRARRRCRCAVFHRPVPAAIRTTWPVGFQLAVRDVDGDLAPRHVDARGGRRAGDRLAAGGRDQLRGRAVDGQEQVGGRGDVGAVRPRHRQPRRAAERDRGAAASASLMVLSVIRNAVAPASGLTRSSTKSAALFAYCRCWSGRCRSRQAGRTVAGEARVVRDRVARARRCRRRGSPGRGTRRRDRRSRPRPGSAAPARRPRSAAAARPRAARRGCPGRAAAPDRSTASPRLRPPALRAARCTRSGPRSKP